MIVQVTFETLDEFKKFVDWKESKEQQVPAHEPKKEKAEPEEEVEVEKPKKEKKEKKEEPKVDYDALRVEVRKVLAELNKVTGKNTAAEIIKAHGATSGKLSQIEDMFLPSLLEEAKEALEDAE